MKYAIISTHPPRKCGIGIYTKRLLEKLGENILVISLKEHKYTEKNVLPIIDNSFESYIKAKNILVKNKIKAVLIQHEYAFYNKIYFIPFLIMLKTAGIKVILEMHTIVNYGDLIKDHIFRKYNLMMFTFADRIIVHTEYAKKKILGGGIFKKKIRIVPLAIPDKKRVTKKNEKVTNLLCFGFIWHDKGTDIAIKAFSNMNDVKMKIVGSINPSATKKQAKYFEKIKKMAKGTKNIIVIDKFVSEEEKEKLYLEADYLILPYRMISQSAVLTEVWSYGKIPICSDLAPLKEEIGKNEYGVIFRKEDAQDLKNKLSELLKNNKKRDQIQKNIKILQKRRSFEKTAIKIKEMLKNAI